jgi:hypothetical protein
VLFHEAVNKFRSYELEESFELFERAAAKGHEESIWSVSVMKDVEMKNSVLKEAFAKTEEPLGWYFAGELCRQRERFDFMKKSAEGGCSWGQVAYGMYFDRGMFVEKDQKVYLEWLEKAANQNNPRAMRWLGFWFRDDGGDKQKAVSYFCAGAELGWKESMDSLAPLLKEGVGCEKDLGQAVIWSAIGDSYIFCDLLEEAKEALERGATEDLECDFDQLCYSLGWGLYWYRYGSERWNEQDNENRLFGNRCLDFYCSCVELQQKSIFIFLLCWNRTTGGVKGPGQMIAQIVWEGRGNTLVKAFEQRDGEEPDTKRIKK